MTGIVNGWWSIENPSLISSKHTCAYTSTQTHTENTDTLVHTHTWGKSSFAFWDTMIVGKYCCLNLLTDHVLLHICHIYLCMCICMCACVCIYNVKFYSFIYSERKSEDNLQLERVNYFPLWWFLGTWLKLLACWLLTSPIQYLSDPSPEIYKGRKLRNALKKRC